MIAKAGVWLARKLLSRDLSPEDNLLLAATVLDKIGALPYNNVVTVDENGMLLVNGRSLELDQMRNLRESARAALDNQALKVMREQILYAAVVTGVHKAETLQQVLFARAAIWVMQEFDRQLSILAQRKELSL